MLRNLINSSVQVMRKNPSSSIINLFGLTMSLLIASIICLYINQELSADSYHEKADRIYRLTHNEKAGEIRGDRHLPTVGPPVGPALKQSFNAIEDAVRFRYSPDRIMKVGTNQYYESRVYYVDPSIFNIFSFPMIMGNEATALTEPNNVVITSEIAYKYFGEEDPLGKTISLDNSIDLKVTGVLAPIPNNTHLKFDFLIPFSAFKVPHGYPVDLNTWGWISFHTYVLLKQGSTATEIENQLPEFVRTHWPEDRAKKFKIQLQPLSDIYLGEVKHEQIASGSTTYVYVLGIAALLILFISAFNFANLYTAICLTRAKEIGVRKVIGSAKGQISWYIALEAVFLSIVAWGVAMLILPLATQFLNKYGFKITFNIQSPILVAILIVAIGIALLSAFYPSHLLSLTGHQKLLKGTFRTSPRGMVIRKTLVLLQFCVTIALISSVLVINKQMEFIQNKDLGYAKDELLLLRVPGEGIAPRFAALKTKLLQHQQIKSVTLGGGRMDGDNGNVPIYIEGNLEDGVPMSIDAASFNFFETIGVQMVAGREITEHQPADTLRGVLINESAAKVFGWTSEQAIGKKIKIGEIVLDGEVIGVFPDFHFGSLKSEIKPLVMSYPRVYLQDVYVRLNPGIDLKDLIFSLQNDWTEIAPEFPFDHILLSQHLQNQYSSEQLFAILFKLFAIAAILISCLGLFGVVSQDVAFRVKEIGVRKVLGANSSELAILIYKPFIIIIIISMLIAWPFSWFAMNAWLSEFSYRTSQSPFIFIAAGLFTLCAASVTIVYKVVSASRTNPVQSIKNE